MGACAAPADESVHESAEAISETPAAAKAQVIRIDRSVTITDLPTLDPFSLKRVLDFVASTSGDPSLDGASLYKLLWDTNNTKAGGFMPDGQHCDDEKDAKGSPTLNGWPLQCPRQEGALADFSKHNPFCSGPGCDPYSPVAITNRFDLAPANGQTCGQYRIVFAKGVEHSPVETAGNQILGNRNLMIMEAMMPNPHPEEGLAGCEKVVEFWAKLSKFEDPSKRAKELEKFFFKGVAGLPPAFQFDHFTGEVDPQTGEQLSGQWRTNQFMNDQAAGGQRQPWQLREYNLSRSCSSSGKGKQQTCKAKVKMVPVQLNPESSLFDEKNTSPLALKFRDPSYDGGFLSQLPALMVNDINLLNLNRLRREFNTGQSTSQPGSGPNPPPLNDSNYNMVFNSSGPFASKIQAKLNQLKSSLTPTEAVRRAQSQSCAGCHQLATSTASFFGGDPNASKIGAKLVWPDMARGPEVAPGVRPRAFTHISDSVLVPIEDGVTCDTACTANPRTCKCAWEVSPAMSEFFSPFRRDLMQNYLQSLPGGGNEPAGADEDDGY